MSEAPQSPGVMRVKTELVLEQLVSRVLGRALELRAAGLPKEVDTVLADGPEPAELSRLGYAARSAETEMFDVARQPMPWLQEMLADQAAADPSHRSAICRELAADEPDQKPDPGQGSWRVPGPGGHVRHFLALAAADEIVHGNSNGAQPASRELSAGEAKRCFLYGFYAGCCEEAASASRPRARRGSGR
jgi:hypothetical protein